MISNIRVRVGMVVLLVFGGMSGCGFIVLVGVLLLLPLVLVLGGGGGVVGGVFRVF